MRTAWGNGQVSDKEKLDKIREIIKEAFSNGASTGWGTVRKIELVLNGNNAKTEEKK
jgi:hypothetical protein